MNRKWSQIAKTQQFLWVERIASDRKNQRSQQCLEKAICFGIDEFDQVSGGEKSNQIGRINTDTDAINRIYFDKMAYAGLKRTICFQNFS